MPDPLGAAHVVRELDESTWIAVFHDESAFDEDTDFDTVGHMVFGVDKPVFEVPDDGEGRCVLIHEHAVFVRVVCTDVGTTLDETGEISITLMDPDVVINDIKVIYVPELPGARVSQAKPRRSPPGSKSGRRATTQAAAPKPTKRPATKKPATKVKKGGK